MTDPTAQTNEGDTELVSFVSPVDQLCQFGDVILKVEDPSGVHPTKRFQVSTCILAQVAPFLSRLLKGMFKEGEINNQGQMLPREVPLKGSPKAVEILCYLLHHRPYNNFEDGSPVDVIEYANLVDQYNCIDQLKFPNTILLRAHIDKHLHTRLRDDTALFNLVAAAYILDVPVIFRDLSRMLAIYVAKTINLNDFDVKCHDHIPPILIDTLNAQVAAARQALSYGSGVLISAYCKAAGICNRAGLCVEFVRRLTDASILPPTLDRSIDTLLDRLEHIEVPALLSDQEYCRCPFSMVTMTGIIRACHSRLAQSLFARRIDRGTGTAALVQYWSKQAQS